MLAQRLDHVAGCLLGGALGDAMGAPYEGQARVDQVVFQTGTVSDDTQLTLATCEGIIAGKGSVRPELIAGRFAAWFRAGRVTGVGATTLRSLHALSEGTHWAIAGRSGEFAAGAGAAMRIAPLAFVIDPFDQKARVQIRDVVRITHNNDEAYAAALAVVLAVRISLEGHSGHEGLERIAHAMPDSRTLDALLDIANDQLTPNDAARKLGTSGFAPEVVPVALCAAFTGGDILDTLKSVVGFGGDADTLASITGQVMGARIGASRLPPQTKAVEVYDETLAIADALAKSLDSESWWRRLLRRD